MNSANQAVSGGIGGFLAFFLLACALWLLMRNMNSRLRNVKYREELDLERQAVEADQDVVSRPPRRGEADASGRLENDGRDGAAPEPQRERQDGTPISRG